MADTWALQDYKEAFEELMPRSLTMTSFDLAEVAEGSTREGWKKFLAEPATRRQIEEEMEEQRKVSLNQLIADAGSSNSVGKSNLINSLVNVGKNANEARGPAFIFCHIPLTTEEKHAPAVGRVNGERVR